MKQTATVSPPALAPPGAVSILLVDDQQANLIALEAILNPSDYRLVHARSAQEALLILLDGEFAAIVLDINMPIVNGIELAQIIKKRARTRDIPILFLTAYLVDEKDILLGYGAGAIDYLSKPVHPDILRSKIAAYVDLHRKTRALAVANAAHTRARSKTGLTSTFRRLRKPSIKPDQKLPPSESAALAGPATKARTRSARIRRKFFILPPNVQITHLKQRVCPSRWRGDERPVQASP